MANKANRKNQSLPLTEIAFQKIKEMIVTLKLKPGDQIDDGLLAESLSIGRTPLREALFRLVAENLVEVVHGRGFFVRDFTLNDLRDLFETMLILERAAVALAAKRIRKDQIESLKRINDELAEAWLTKDYLRVTLLNSQFHRIIYAATGNGFLSSYLNNLQNQSQRLAYICFSKESSAYDIQSHAETSIKDHRQLIDLLEQGNDADGMRVITEHVKHFHRRVHHFASPPLDNLDSITPAKEEL